MKLTIYKNCAYRLAKILLTSNTSHWQSYKYTSIDLILDGGAFSGSYLLGGLIYLQCISHFVKISRISGTSVGSLFGLLFLSNLLCKYNGKFYRKFRKCFKKNGNLSILKECLYFIKQHISDDFYLTCNDIFYITYFNIITKKQVVRHTYYSNDDLLECVYSSCFLPMLIDGKISHQGKYIDGIIPYIFPENAEKKIIFMDLHSNYLRKMVNIKNETNNHFRIFSGIFETHHFFMYGSSNLCFNIYNHRYYYKFIIYLRQYIGLKVISILSFIQSLYLKSNNYMHSSEKQSQLVKLYYFIVNYVMNHFKHIFPSIIKCIANSYLI